jgi:hypothetical protein
MDTTDAKGRGEQRIREQPALFSHGYAYQGPPPKKWLRERSP